MLTVEGLQDKQFGYVVPWSIQEVNRKNYIKKGTSVQEKPSGTVQQRIENREGVLFAVNWVPSPSVDVNADVSFHTAEVVDLNEYLEIQTLLEES